MTREEAVKIIDCYDIGFYDLSGEKIPADKLAKAFDMAIEALSADAVHGFRGGKIPPKEMLDGTVLIPIHQWLEMERELAELKEKFESAESGKVVRCKDCRHRCKDPIYSKADPHWVIYQIGDCPIICKTVGDDDYCSFGERREE